MNVLENDSDVDGDTLTLTQFTDTSNGILTNNNNGTFTYTPDQGFIGTDSFTYTVTDGQKTSTATAQITVSGIVQDGNFSAINGDFTRNSGTTLSSHAGQGWIQPRGHKWSKDTVKEWAYADNSGALGLTQVIASNNITQGLQTISFDGVNIGTDNTLRLQVYGIDFGSGYEYIALRFVTGGVSDPDTEFQAIDNVFIGNSANSSVPVEGTITQVNTITGTDGQDILDGTSEDDLIEGNDGNDTLTGNAGNDDLRGGIGDDILRGGAGDDNLRGGSGNDIFNFSANQGRDRIWDFELGDKIRLKDINPQSLELIELNGNTFLDLGNNQGIELLGVLPDVLKINVLANVIELIL
ncbi:cadherin-like domain-containing protein [Crocosphaera watsonii WH 8501]|uniref:cadherin-like domain-containing protein n=1 Tax=Crocosphaera watsonii TaxID=263511 RepID=UPI003990BB88